MSDSFVEFTKILSSTEPKRPSFWVHFRNDQAMHGSTEMLSELCCYAKPSRILMISFGLQGCKLNCEGCSGHVRRLDSNTVFFICFDVTLKPVLLNFSCTLTCRIFSCTSVVFLCYLLDLEFAVDYGTSQHVMLHTENIVLYWQNVIVTT